MVTTSIEEMNLRKDSFLLPLSPPTELDKGVWGPTWSLHTTTILSNSGSSLQANEQTRKRYVIIMIIIGANKRGVF